MSIQLTPVASPSIVITEEDSPVTINLEPSVIIEVGDSGIQPPRSNNIGVMFLKDNDIPTPIASINARAVASGTVQTGELVNFEKHSTTNSLRYLGESGNYNDRVSFIVQNKDAASEITIEFLKLIAWQ